MSKKTFILHPFLFAVFPVLSIYAHNASELIFLDIFEPLAIVFGVTLCLVGLSCLVFRNIEKAAFFVSALWISSTLYGHLYINFHHQFQIAGFEIMRHGILMPFYILFLLGLFLTLILIKKPLSTISKSIHWFSLFLFISCLVSVSFAEWKKTAMRQSGISTSPVAPGANIHGEALPDIYYIIPDRYPRQDFLREELDFDNTDFINKLKKRDFYIPEKGTSNYSATSLSIASTLNMDYIQNLIEKMPVSYNLTPLAHLMKDNRVVRFLKSNGYEFISFETEYSLLNFFREADQFMSHGWVPNQITGQLYEVTPLPGLTRFLYFLPRLAHEKHRQKILSDLDGLSQIAGDYSSSKPRFIFLYLMCPHEPFVFGENGERIETADVFTIKPLFTDALKVAYVPATADWETFQEKHNQQLTFLNKKLIEVADQILAHSKKPPIIIIQSDHGINISPPINSMKNFIALHLPDFPKEEFYDSISSVNIFRLIFNFYLKSNLPLLQDKQYYPHRYYENPYDLTEIREEGLGTLSPTHLTK